MRHGTNGFTSLPKEGMQKNLTASAGFEPRNLGTKGMTYLLTGERKIFHISATYFIQSGGKFSTKGANKNLMCDGEFHENHYGEPHFN